MKPVRQPRELIAVTHPALHVLLDPSKEVINMALVVEPLRIQIGMAVLSRGAGDNIILAQSISNFLEAVADPKHGDAEVEERGINVGRAILVYAVGTARENDALGFEWEIGEFLGAWEHFTVYIQVAEPPGDEMGLESEVSRAGA